MNHKFDIILYFISMVSVTCFGQTTLSQTIEDTNEFEPTTTLSSIPIPGEDNGDKETTLTSLLTQEEPDIEKNCSNTLGDGVCMEIDRCPVVKDRLNQGLTYLSENNKGCDWTLDYQPLVCCPIDVADAGAEIEEDIFNMTLPPTGSSLGVKEIEEKNVVTYNIATPPSDSWPCGYPSPLGDLAYTYSLNETAEEYKKEGFIVTPLEVDVDQLTSVHITNGTYEKTINLPSIGDAVGGEDARRRITVYMALLGERLSGRENKIDWFCDGVIINRDWILSAAHCFLQRTANVVRLGEYDLSNDVPSRTEFPMDFGIEKVVIYPKYAYPSSYHDLSLIKLDRKIPYYREDMLPVCLPWQDESKRNLIGKQVTLTGWGATVHSGPMHPVVQEVNVTVFEPSLCDKSYSNLGDYASKFPKGIGPETSLCAGDLQGGKDACQGDSGGPIVYQGEEFGPYTLAGIVSAGFGCGLKEFPGIYVPIQRPEYLSWIRDVAFAHLLNGN